MKEAHRNIETRFVISCQKNHTLDILDQAMELGLAGDYYNYVIVSFVSIAANNYLLFLVNNINFHTSFRPL